MKLTEFWSRMEHHLGDVYAHVWASEHVLSGLGYRTVDQALAAGVETKQVWLAVWAELELSPSDR